MEPGTAEMRPDVMVGETTMGQGADWYDYDSAERCGDEAYFAVRILAQCDYAGNEQDLSSVVAGPFPTEEEAWEAAESICELGEQ